ncbi:MAG: CoA-binding protein [Dehalococcoidia bacterium]|nr:CoA-binding protein [Dehalococcoidia bacterium]
MDDNKKLEQIESAFYPESIAVVGASADEHKFGTLFLHSLQAHFKGRIYPVNPNQTGVAGLQAYPSVEAIPHPVDYVIVATPRGSILDTVGDCVRKGVKAIHIFSAGFSESGEGGYQELEREMVSMAQEGGARIIGPNCLGLCCPTGNLPFGPEGIMPKSGKVAFVSQSGGIAVAFVLSGIAADIRFSKVAAFGNGSDLDGADFLEYLKADGETEIVGMYLEGAQDCRPLFKLIREVTPVKPVVVLKGGKSEAGNRGAFSHTGAIAGSKVVWEAALKQAHAIEVQGVEELTDTVLAFQQLGRLGAKGAVPMAGLLGAGGGMVVTSSDIFTREGIPLPVFSRETEEKLRKIIPQVGSILRNPLDVGAVGSRPEALAEAMEVLADDPETGIIVVIEMLDQLLLVHSMESVRAIHRVFAGFREKRSMPFAVVLYPALAEKERSEIVGGLSRAQIPVYPSLDRAARAIANVRRYWKFRDELEEGSGGARR